MKPLYKAICTATGGREGRVVSRDNAALDLKLGFPQALGGPGGDITNPEQLFAAGYAACFESALRLIARTQRKPLNNAAVTAEVILNQLEDKTFQLAVELRAELPDLPRQEAEELLAAAHQICPYSRATRGNIRVDLKLA